LTRASRTANACAGFVRQALLVAAWGQVLERHAQAPQQLAAIGRGRGQNQAGYVMGIQGVLRAARCALKNKGLSANSF